MIKLRIDPKFQAIIPPVTDEERDQLAANLAAEGRRDPLVVWAGEPPTDAAHACGVPWGPQLPWEETLTAARWLCRSCREIYQRLYGLFGIAATRLHGGVRLLWQRASTGAGAEPARGWPSRLGGSPLGSCTPR
jgi:hypothetical protein